MPGPFHLLCTRRSPTAAAIALVLRVRPPTLCIAGAARTRVLAGAPVVTVGCRDRRGRRCSRDGCTDPAHHGVFLRLRDEPLSLATAGARAWLTLVPLRWNRRRAGSLVPKSSTESRAASASEIVLIRAAGRAGSKAATPGTQ